MFTTKDLVCDEVKELRDIAKKTTDLSVKVEREGSRGEASLTFSSSTTLLMLIGFTKEEKLDILDRLNPVFRRRNLSLRTFAHSNFKLFIKLAIIWPATMIVLSFLPNIPPMGR
jgi:hypothetical protein